MALLEESENALKTYQMYFDLISNRITDRAQVSEGRNWDTLLPFFTSFSPPSQTLPLAEKIMSARVYCCTPPTAKEWLLELK